MSERFEIMDYLQPKRGKLSTTVVFYGDAAIKLRTISERTKRSLSEVVQAFVIFGMSQVDVSDVVPFPGTSLPADQEVTDDV